ncbi:MAG: AIR synthase related protein [Clostridium sp.]|nr:AIR synthase related protein [Bacteroides sp.]MCM1199317.1 AIR synthase related protein [Clostridium sp.]
MSEENFSDLGRVEAIERLYEGTGYRPFEDCRFETAGKAYSSEYTKVLLEGIDFDLTYFPLKHLGYKSVVAVTGELYAAMAHPRTLSLTLGISAKLDFMQIKEFWSGAVTAAREHGYSKVSLDLVPSRNGLCIAVSGSGETSLLTGKRRPAAKSMDLICVSDNLGAAYFGQMVLEREKAQFNKEKDERNQPKLEEYKHLVGAYLKPELNHDTVKQLEDAGIIPSYGYFVTRGLSDAVKRLVRDSGLGAKVYADKIPFAGKTFDLGKEMNIDPISAAMNGGDDYRILYTVPIGNHDKFRHDFQTFDIIGHLAKPEVGAVIVTPDGLELPLKSQGWK